MTTTTSQNVSSMVSVLIPAPKINDVSTDALDVPVEIYEPSAQDKIQRVLYRLDHGEQLSRGQLKQDDNFCVLGLFADEYGFGEWELQRNNTFRYVVNIPKKRGLISYLSADMANYYGLKTTSGRFYIKSLPEPLQSDLVHLLKSSEDYCLPNQISLAVVNDELLDAGFSIKIVNDILSRIIRSGVIFKKPRKPKEN